MKPGEGVIPYSERHLSIDMQCFLEAIETRGHKCIIQKLLRAQGNYYNKQCLYIMSIVTKLHLTTVVILKNVKRLSLLQEIILIS